MDAHAKLQPSTRLRRLDAVLQRILGQRLQEETRHEGVERVRMECRSRSSGARGT
jgi:hypothetical protein